VLYQELEGLLAQVLQLFGALLRFLAQLFDLYPHLLEIDGHRPSRLYEQLFEIL
jgi:hypothetical protein